MDTTTYQNVGNLKSPIFTPRPGWGARTKAWLGRNWLKALAVIAILVVGITIAIDQLDKTDTDKTATATATPFPTAKPSGIVSGSTTERYEFRAAPGQGITHLARLAIGSHLNNNPGTSLVPEQRVFAEDYLKDRVLENRSSPWLEINEAIAFEIADVRAAISAALTLTAQEIRSLARWAHLVVGF